MAHIRDLMKAGEKVTVLDSAQNEFKIWVTRPSSLQQEKSRERANGTMARIKLTAMDEEGDRYMSIKLSFAEITDHDELIELRMRYDEGDFRDLAFNEVLYGTDGDEESEETRWSKDDYYQSVLQAITDRMSEIITYNDQMKEAGSDDQIIEADDAELLKLMAVQKEFRDELDERVEVHAEDSRAEHNTKSKKQLRKELMHHALELEGKMAWYETFQNNMVFFATRYNDDRKKFYFKDAEEVMEIPDYVRTQLYRAYERIEQGSDDLKNLLSPPSS